MCCRMNEFSLDLASGSVSLGFPFSNFARTGEFFPRAEEVSTTMSASDRRQLTRYNIRTPLRFRAINLTADKSDHFTEALNVSRGGFYFASSAPLQIGTPIMLSNLPGGGSVTATVANCLPLGNEGTYFLVGVALYTHGNVWGIADPPQDWNVAAQSAAASASGSGNSGAANAPTLTVNKKVWPYNVFSEAGENTSKRR